MPIFIYSMIFLAKNKAEVLTFVNKIGIEFNIEQFSTFHGLCCVLVFTSILVNILKRHKTATHTQKIDDLKFYRKAFHRLSHHLIKIMVDDKKYVFWTGIFNIRCMRFSFR